MIVPFNLRMEELGGDPEGVLRPEPGPVEGFMGASHDLDVLLRHRLLPQPGGFEGLPAEAEGTECAGQSEVILLHGRPARA